MPEIKKNVVFFSFPQFQQQPQRSNVLERLEGRCGALAVPRLMLLSTLCVWVCGEGGRGLLIIAPACANVLSSAFPPESRTGLRASLE